MKASSFVDAQATVADAKAAVPRPSIEERSMWNRKLAFVFSMVSLMACAAESPNGGAGDADTLVFASSAELLTWLSAKAADHPGAQVLRGSDGSVSNIRFDDTAARDGLLEEFQPYKIVQVAGQNYNVDGTRLSAGDLASDTEVRQSALSSDSTFCSNGLCIEGSSTNRHYSLFGVGYNEVGAATGITSGATKTYYCPLSFGGFGSLQCGPGFQLTADIEYASRCKGGSNIFGYSCVRKTGTQHVGVTISYFTTATGSPTLILTENAFLTDFGSVGKSYISLGTANLACPIGPTFECAVSGVCANHDADTPTASVSGATAAGSTACQ